MEMNTCNDYKNSRCDLVVKDSDKKCQSQKKKMR